MALAHPPDGAPPHLFVAELASGHTLDLAPAPAAPRRLAAAPAVAPPAVELAVVVVNFCQWKNTARLVRQLRRSAALRTGQVEIQVVDNGSPNHPLAARVAKLRGVSVRRFDANLGFAAAVNRGCRLAGGGWVLLLNPDITVPDGFLDDVLGVLARADASPDVGVIGFRLLNRDGTPQPSAGPFPTFARTLAGLLLPRARRKCRNNRGNTRRAVEWATGGCLLIRRECFEQLGGLDESFFLYYEDVDFCRRAAAGGWGVWFDPALEVTHHWPLHARPVPAPLRLITRHALLTYARRHWSRWQSRALSGVVWAEAGARQLWASLRGRKDAARCFGELRKLVGDVAAERDEAANERIRFAAGFLHPVAAAQDGRTS
jgi:GT2 family glycosyltransferase